MCDGFSVIAYVGRGVHRQNVTRPTRKGTTELTNIAHARRIVPLDDDEAAHRTNICILPGRSHIPTRTLRSGDRIVGASFGFRDTHTLCSVTTVYKVMTFHNSPER